MSNIKFLYNVNDIIKDDRRNLKIKARNIRLTNRKDGRNYNAKMYNMNCLTCGWDDFWMEECELKRGRGCSCCAGKTVVAEINSVAHTHPFIIDYFIGGYEEASKYTRYTEKRIVFRCPYCKEKSQPYLISNIIKNHGFACSCNTHMSFPERVLKELLDKLEVKYIHQLSKSYFSWVNSYKYDFYIPELNAIIETHGVQHYRESTLTYRSLKEEQLNDENKQNLAYANGIKYYFVIDCRESSLDYIKKSILSNKEFCELIQIKNNSFTELELYDSNDYKNICDLWNNTHKTILSISKTLGIDREYVKKILVLSSQNNDTNFSEKLMKNNISLNMSQKSKPFECVEKQMYFKNPYICQNVSLSVFGQKLYKSSIANHLLNNKPYKGYTFKYISKNKYNKLKEEFPEKCFGDSFIL